MVKFFDLIPILVNNDIFLKHKDKDIFKISPDFPWQKWDEKFPKWCQKILIKMIKKKFAFVFAYHHFINIDDIKAEDNFNQLPDKNDKTFIAELMELGILESCNVNLKALNEDIPNGNLFHHGSGFVLNNKPSQHYYKALSATQNTIRKTFSKQQHHQTIVSKISQEQIENVLKEKASARQKYETLDIQFMPIQEVLNSLNIDGINVQSITHSFPYLINPCEMRWSKKTLVTLGMVGSGAAIQLAAGVSLVIVTFGLGAFAGKFLITEGISDAFFCAKTVWNGKSGNYLRYKTASMALNVALCGITEPLKYVKEIPSFLSKDVVKVIRKADIFISGGGAVLKTLIPSLKKIEKCETTKNFISEAIKFTIQEINARFLLILGETFQNAEKLLKPNMFQFYQKIGIQNGDKVFEGQENVIIREIEPLLISLFSFVVTEVNKKCIQNSTINLANYSVIIGAIMKSQKFEQFIYLIKQNLDACISNISVMIKQRTDKNESASVFEEASEAEIVESTLKIIKEWKIQLEKRCQRLLESKINRPLNELNNMDYQNQLREIVADALPRPNSSQNSKRATAQSLTSFEMLCQKIKTEYFFELENLLETTKNEETLAILSLKTARNHQISVNSFI